jgi:ATP-binding cassette subfamily C (CFTR/MRP) protein 1
VYTLIDFQTLTFTWVLLAFILLVLWSTKSATRTTASIPSAILNLIVSITILPLSHIQSARSVRASSSIIIYLLLSTFLDLPQLRTLILRDHSSDIAVVFALILAAKIGLLLVELQDKSALLKPEYNNLPPESTSNILSRSFLWWLNPLFVLGSRSLLFSRSLFGLDDELLSLPLGSDMRESWYRQGRRLFLMWEWETLTFVEVQRGGRFVFVYSLMYLTPRLARVIIPRLCLTGFTFAQPFLITRVLDLLYKPSNDASQFEGYILILICVLIYIGIAVSRIRV